MPRTSALLPLLVALVVTAILPAAAGAASPVPAPPCATPGFAALVAGQEGFVPVAQHCPPDDADRDPEQWEIRVDFGDGTSALAAFDPAHWFAGGVHTYAQPGTYHVVAVVLHKPSGQTSTYEADVQVAPPPQPPASAPALPAPVPALPQPSVRTAALPCPAVELARPASEGKEGFVAVAQHCPRAHADRDVGSFTVSMDYGDGTTGRGTMDAWTYTFGGTHRYRTAGAYAVTGVVRNLRTGQEWTYKRRVVVRNPPLVAADVPRPRFTVGRTGEPQPIVAFTDGNPLAGRGSHTARIAWGDGTSSRGTVREDEDGRFVVLGRHRYTRERSRTITVRVSDGRQRLVVRTRGLVGRVYSKRPRRPGTRKAASR